MRLTSLRRLIDSIRCQRGQVLVAGVGVIVLSLGAIMISVDAGWWLRDKRDAQNDADAIALAAAQELPDRTAAELRGEDWAVANGIDPSTELEMLPEDCPDGDIQGKFCFIDQNSDGDDDMVRVKVNRPSNSFIAEAFGVGSPTLSPPAAAAKLFGIASCVMPWGIVAGNTDPYDFYGLDRTALYIFQDTEDNTPGNYGSISIYGKGADIYKEVIESTSGCPDPTNSACVGEDVLVGEGETLDECATKPGTLGKTTANSLDVRYAGGVPDIDCDATSLAQATAFSNSPECGDRAIPLGIIDAFPPSGSSADISIYGIAIFYIAGWDRAPAWGNGDADGDPNSGYVWGYLLEDIPVSPAWQMDWGVSENPFAPVGFFLVE